MSCPGVETNKERMERLQKEFDEQYREATNMSLADFEKMKKSGEITKTHFVQGGAVSSVGNTLRPWKNNVTIYKDCPFHEEIVEAIKGIDPDIEIQYTAGWKLVDDTPSVLIDTGYMLKNIAAVRKGDEGKRYASGEEKMKARNTICKGVHSWVSDVPGGHHCVNCGLFSK
jgi:hypothetical protein